MDIGCSFVFKCHSGPVSLHSKDPKVCHSCKGTLKTYQEGCWRSRGKDKNILQSVYYYFNVKTFYLPRAYLNAFDFPVPNDEELKTSPFYGPQRIQMNGKFGHVADNRRMARKADLVEGLEAGEQPVDYYNKWILENMG